MKRFLNGNARLLVWLSATKAEMSAVDPKARKRFKVNLDNIKPEDRRIKNEMGLRGPLFS